MDNSSNIMKFELLCFVVNFGLGEKVAKIAKRAGITGCTIFLGKGTIQNRLLEFLEINDSRKEIVFIIAEKRMAYEALKIIDKEFELSKPNHGIAFTFSLNDLIGVRNQTNNSNYNESEDLDKAMHKAIFVVVEKGKAEDVIAAAVKAGSKGGTIVNARGSGIHETSTLFSMAIEPEKEIVIILAENELTETVVSSINSNLKISEPGNGIMFILDVNKAYGLY